MTEPHTCEGAIDSREAARLLGYTKKNGHRTIERMAQHKKLPAFKVGKYWRFRRSVLDKWMAEQLGSWCQPRPSSIGGIQ